MRPYRILAIVRSLAVPAVVAGAVLVMLGEVIAHENHAPLPTKGVTIAGDTIMLSNKAREAIGLTTAKVQLSDIHRIVTVNARVEIPWHAQSMITSLVPGKIDKVLFRPGETVTAGQELAWISQSRAASRSAIRQRNSKYVCQCAGRCPAPDIQPQSREHL